MKNPANIGDVLSYSWGYDQTNIEWYKVTKVTPASVQLVRVAGKYEETGFMSGTTVPDLSAIIGAPITKRVQLFRSPYAVSFDYGIGVVWDGKPEYESHYA